MVYDVDGNRVAWVDADGAATVFLYGHEYTTTPAAGTNTTRYYEHAGDTIATRTDSTSSKGDIIWLGSDQLDSATWAVNAATRAATIRYNDPYGNSRDGSNTPQWPAGQRGYVGGVTDPTGLTLLGARFYDPRTGVFISVDPEVDEYDPQRLHAYAYANNNPVTFSDPDGLFWGAIKNGMQKAASSVASGVTSAAKAVVNNAGTIATVAGTVATVAAFLPPPAQVVAAAAGAVAAVAGAIDTAKSCASGSTGDCAVGIASMLPGVRQARNAARGVGAAKAVVKKAVGECPNSFAPGTRVLMADGSTKAIEDIKPDDVVRSTDPETGEDGARPVTNLITGHGDKQLFKISIDGDGDGVADGSVTATHNHPFWVASEQAWMFADGLQKDMELLTPDGARVTVMAIVAWDAVATVYNLTVDDLHTYYVLAGETAFLVHNSGGGSECGALALLERAKELQHFKSNTAVARVRSKVADADGNFEEQVWVASSRAYMPKKWREPGTLKSNERYVPSSGKKTHSEEDIVAHLGDRWEIIEGASRYNICRERCLPALRSKKVHVGGPVFPTFKYSPWRLFWKMI